VTLETRHFLPFSHTRSYRILLYYSIRNGASQRRGELF
jgi:hypothetical protein